MPFTVVVHVVGQDPFEAELEALPDPKDQSLIFTNPRLRGGKAVTYIDSAAVSVIFPWHRISFLEVMPAEEGRGEIDLFFRT